MDTQRQRITVTGQVQGVGFRPFVYRLAHSHALTGHVCNTNEGVVIEVQGAPEALRAFAHSLHHDLPPLASITQSEQVFLPPILPVQGIQSEAAFTIRHSQHSGHTGHSVRISPDTATCRDCEADIQDASNRRYRYPFTNCTNCGPRYTITRAIPYDRATTSMACFPQCAQCQTEYDNPLDRRFHAQPNACPVCGPRIWIDSHSDTNGVLYTVATALREGKIVAIKGLGGFHLACDAHNIAAIEELRRRKRRPHKPLAVMVQNIEAAHTLAHISNKAAALLQSVERPIVVCPRKSTLPDILSPDTPTIGLMLPYTPLHRALFDVLDEPYPPYNAPIAPIAPVALVMTSGNAGGEPICLGNREALTRLAPLADLFVLHDRDILVRVDDSVCTPLPAPHTHIIHRRSRGFVPRATPLLQSGPCVLGVGAQLKATLCLTRGDAAFMSQHIGDVENLETFAFYEEVAAHLEMLLEVQPEAVVCDTHPDFMTTRFAKALAQARGIPLLQIQHHVAHAWSLLAENNYEGQALVWALDGTGYGEDGTAWGGELLLVDTGRVTHRRVGRFAPFALPGGDMAVREPWRIALALLWETGLDVPPVLERTLDKTVDATARDAVLQMLQKNIRCTRTSSAGRLFDAVSAVLGLCTHTSYEGQAPLRLEAAQIGPEEIDIRGTGNITPFTADYALRGDMWELDSHALFAAVVEDIQRGTATGTIAQRFHRGLAQGLAAMAARAALEYGIGTIGFSGGVMQNATMAKSLPQLITNTGMRVLTHRDVPANDGGISFGQAAFGQRMYIKTMRV